MGINDFEQNYTIVITKRADQAEKEKQRCKHPQLTDNTLQDRL